MPDPEVARLSREWLRYAQADLASAEGMLSSRDPHQPRHVCFAAQQAAEKALKALLVSKQIEFPFTHDLGELAALVDGDQAVGQAAGDLLWLTQWAAAPRYPGDVEPDWSDAERGVVVARPVVLAAREALA